MCKTASLLCAFLLCACVVSRDSVAQSFIIGEENYEVGVTISSPRGKVVSPELIVGPRCTLTNNGSKGIVSYTIVWTAVTASGGSVDLATSGDASPILQPNQSLEVIGSGTMRSSSEDPIVSIRVSVVHVVFSDGSDSGGVSLGQAEQIGCPKSVIDKLLRHLLRVYQERGCPSSGIKNELKF